jgi:hypothetical protein
MVHEARLPVCSLSNPLSHVGAVVVLQVAVRFTQNRQSSSFSPVTSVMGFGEIEDGGFRGLCADARDGSEDVLWSTPDGSNV